MASDMSNFHSSVHIVKAEILKVLVVLVERDAGVAAVVVLAVIWCHIYLSNPDRQSIDSAT